MIKRFVKKPVEILAVRWTGDNYPEIKQFVGESCCIFHGSSFEDQDLVIRTLEGDHHALVGDWIICGVKGEFYPCKPDIFEQTYDPV